MFLHSRNRRIRSLALLAVGSSVLASFAFACIGPEPDFIPSADAGGDGDGGLLVKPPPARIEPTTRVVVGGDNICASRGDAGIRCMGSNVFGQLGHEERDGNPHPPPGLALPGAWAAPPDIHASHACALTPNQEVSCWGSNNSGQAGRDPSADGGNIVQAAPVSGTAGAHLAVTGTSFSCAAFATKVTCWGTAAHGRIGPLEATSSFSPNVVPGLDGVSELESGDEFTCARKGNNGTVWCWGNSRYGQIGPSEEPDASAGDNLAHPIPRQLAEFGDARALSVGADHACVLRESGAVFCWGRNLRGELGHDPTTDPSCLGSIRCNPQPTSVSGLLAVREIALGETHSCALQGDDTVACWGNNSLGQLGHDPALDDNGSATPTRFVPIGVTGLSNVAHIAAGGDTTCAVTWNDELFCWGNNARNQLGLPDGGRSSFAPVAMAAFP